MSTDSLSRSEERFLRQGLTSKAFTLWCDGRNQALTLDNARELFDFGVGSGWKERLDTLRLAREAASKAKLQGVAGADELEQLIEYAVTEFPQLFASRLGLK